ncbi:MAG TPA: rod shape-determining protein MreC [Gaiellaceae bacterium]
MASRDRTARVAVLGTSVQRSRNERRPPRGRNAQLRRAVLVVLVLIALVLLTVSFRSPTSGALHTAQGYGATVLRPFQVAAERVARPFRDAYDYVTGLTGAKSENEKLKREVRQLRAQATANLAGARRAAELEALLRFENLRSFPKDYAPVNTTVISFPGTPFAQQVTIAAGANSGIRINTPVVTADGLIGRVTNVFPSTSQVTLLNDEESSVAAVDVTHNVSGLIRRGPRGTFILDRVPKEATVEKGDVVVTRGTVDRRYPSYYPYGIQIGTVLSASPSDIATFLSVQVTPYARFDSLDAVAALVPKTPK